MKIFITWYGDLSHKVALLLWEWLPLVVQEISPFVSTEEIRMGSTWFKKLMTQLNQSDFGLVCLTHDNLNAPWLLFEAGAIANRFDRAHVYALLIDDLSDQDLEQPLHSFQSIKLNDKEDMRKLIHTLNLAHGTRIISANVLDSEFNRGWTKFAEDFNQAIEEMKLKGVRNHPKLDRQLIEEINNRCLLLAETLEIMSSDIKEMKKNTLKSREKA